METELRLKPPSKKKTQQPADIYKECECIHSFWKKNPTTKQPKNTKTPPNKQPPHEFLYIMFFQSPVCAFPYGKQGVLGFPLWYFM